jgi:hypothetical protein
MNTEVQTFPPMYAIVRDEIVEVTPEPIAVTEALAALPIVRKVLSGYEISMRRHAAACEAGR